VLIVVALVFLDQNTGLYSPTMACTQIATFMEVVAVKRATGNPSMV
jgi:hypothetical protein